MPLIYANQLARSLNPVQPCYCLVGADPFLVQESATQIRLRAGQQGYDQRQVFTLENPSQFDWEGFHQSLFAFSLFAEKTIVEWIWQTNKLSEKTFQPCLPFELDDRVCVIIRAGHLSKAQLNAKWFKAFMGSAVIVQHWPPQGQELINWTEQRARHHALSLTPSAAKLLAHHYEGRLYGIDQVLMKLALFPHEDQVDIDTIHQHIDAQSSFDVFALQSALITQDASKVLVVLNHFKHMKVEITLVLWCLNRLLQTLQQAPQHDTNWLKSQGIWPKEQTFFHRWLSTLTSNHLQTMIQSLCEIDQLHKTGQVTESWQKIAQLCLTSIGALPHVDPNPGI